MPNVQLPNIEGFDPEYLGEALGAVGTRLGPTTPVKNISDNIVGESKLKDNAVTNRTIDNFAVDSAEIKDAAVTNIKVVSMQAGKITSDTLTADVIMGGFIRTASSGARLELNSTGLHGFNSGGVELVTLANTGLFTLRSAGSGQRVELTAASGLQVFNSGGSNTVNLNDTGLDLQLSSGGDGLNLIAAESVEFIRRGQGDSDTWMVLGGQYSASTFASGASQLGLWVQKFRSGSAGTNGLAAAVQDTSGNEQGSWRLFHSNSSSTATFGAFLKDSGGTLRRMFQVATNGTSELRSQSITGITRDNSSGTVLAEVALTGSATSISSPNVQLQLVATGQTILLQSAKVTINAPMQYLPGDAAGFGNLAAGGRTEGTVTWGFTFTSEPSVTVGVNNGTQDGLIATCRAVSTTGGTATLLNSSAAQSNLPQAVAVFPYLP